MDESSHEPVLVKDHGSSLSRRCRASNRGFPSENSYRGLSLEHLRGKVSVYAEASRLIRKMRGGAQAHLIEATDGSSYVVKFANNPQHTRILINEWVTSIVLRHLGILTPDTILVNFSARFIRNNRELYVDTGSYRVAPICGYHFGSRFLGEPARVVYDQLPTAMLEGVANLSDFCGALVADKWLGNTDTRQTVFVRSPVANPLFPFVVHMIDNGNIFNGGDWRFVDSPLHGPYASKVYQHVRSIEDFEPWLTTIEDFPRSMLEEAFQQIPQSWCSGETEVSFGVLLSQLMRRRGRVRDLIQACRSQPPNPFPNWSS